MYSTKYSRPNFILFMWNKWQSGISSEVLRLLWELLVIKCFMFPQMERLARADILVKDLYVENAHLIATVQRLEQHCQVLVQMTSDCSSVWIWLCHSQIYWFRTLGRGCNCNVVNKVRGFICVGCDVMLLDVYFPTFWRIIVPSCLHSKSCMTPMIKTV